MSDLSNLGDLSNLSDFSDQNKGPKIDVYWIDCSFQAERLRDIVGDHYLRIDLGKQKKALMP